MTSQPMPRRLPAAVVLVQALLCVAPVSAAPASGGSASGGSALAGSTLASAGTAPTAPTQPVAASPVPAPGATQTPGPASAGAPRADAAWPPLAAGASAPAARGTPPPAGVTVPSAEEAPKEASYVVEGAQVVVVQGAARTPLPSLGVARAVHLDGTRLYVARGSSAVDVYDVSEPARPAFVSRLVVRGGAVGFHAAEGQVWVVVQERSAVPLQEAAEVAPGAAAGPAVGGPRAGMPTAPAPSASRQVVARDIAILKASPGRVELAVGAREGVRIGDRFAVFRSRVLEGEGSGAFAGEELVTVAEVVAVREDTSLAELGRSAQVVTTDRARAARVDQTNSNALPPRVAQVGEVSVVLRPLVNAGRPLGAGVLADVEASYWGKAHFLGVALQPVGLGLTDDGAIVATTALAEGGYDGHAISVGLGLGVSWINGDLDHMLSAFGGSRDASMTQGPSPTVTEHQETHAAFTLSQVARLGARDGLNLWLRNVLILHKDSETAQSGFIYGGTIGRLAVPVGGRSDLFVEGGGGLMGYWFAGVGVASWLTGNGSPGSWRLSVSAGAAGISGSKQVQTTYPASGTTPAWTNTYQQDISVAGPMVALGLGYRFAL